MRPLPSHGHEAERASARGLAEGPRRHRSNLPRRGDRRPYPADGESADRRRRGALGGAPGAQEARPHAPLAHRRRIGGTGGRLRHRVDRVGKHDAQLRADACQRLAALRRAGAAGLRRERAPAGRTGRGAGGGVGEGARCGRKDRAARHYRRRGGLVRRAALARLAQPDRPDARGIAAPVRGRRHAGAHTAAVHVAVPLPLEQASAVHRRLRQARVRM